MRIAWPILSLLITAKVLLGLVIGWREGWGMANGVYFAFVTGLTIGYGDLVPTHFLSRFLSIVVGFSGILLTGMIAALAVCALQTAAPQPHERNPVE